MSKFLKNYAKSTMIETKRLVVNPKESDKISFNITIDDIEQSDGLTVDNQEYGKTSTLIADDVEWGENLGVEVRLALIPIDTKHRITKPPLKEYALKTEITCFSTEDTPEDKEKVKELFQLLADSENLHIHSNDYFVLEE